MKIFPELDKIKNLTLDGPSPAEVIVAIIRELDRIEKELLNKLAELKKEWPKAYETYIKAETEENIQWFTSNIKLLCQNFPEIISRITFIMNILKDLSTTNSFQKTINSIKNFDSRNIEVLCINTVGAVLDTLQYLFVSPKRPSNNSGKQELYEFKFDIFSHWPQLKPILVSCQESAKIFIENTFIKCAKPKKFTEICSYIESLMAAIQQYYDIVNKSHEGEKKFNNSIEELANKIGKIKPENSLQSYPKNKKTTSYKDFSSEEKPEETQSTSLEEEEEIYELNLGEAPAREQQHIDKINLIKIFIHLAQRSMYGFLQMADLNWQNQKKGKKFFLNADLETAAKDIKKLQLQLSEYKEMVAAYWGEMFPAEPDTSDNQFVFKNSLINQFLIVSHQLENFWIRFETSNAILLDKLDQSYERYLESQDIKKQAKDYDELISDDTPAKPSRTIKNLSLTGKIWKNARGLNELIGKIIKTHPASISDQNSNFNRFILSRSASLIENPALPKTRYFVELIANRINQDHANNLPIVLHGGWLRAYLLNSIEYSTPVCDIDFILLDSEPKELIQHLRQQGFYKSAKGNLCQIIENDFKIDLLIEAKSEESERNPVPYFLGITAVYWDNRTQKIVDPLPGQQGLLQLYQYVLEIDPRLDEADFLNLLNTEPVLLLRLIQYTSEGYSLGPKLEAALRNINPSSELLSKKEVKEQLEYTLIKIAAKDYEAFKCLPAHHATTRLLIEFRIGEILFKWTEKDPGKLSRHIQKYVEILKKVFAAKNTINISGSDSNLFKKIRERNQIEHCQTGLNPIT